MPYAALQWYIDNGVDEALGDTPIDRFALAPQPKTMPQAMAEPAQTSIVQQAQQAQDAPPPLLGANEAQAEAVKAANAANTLEELQAAIADFGGIEIKKTASNIVFADGNPDAPLMIIGDSPAAEEDRQGKPFVGPHGQLLNRILAAIDLDRDSSYLTNILNWRPPGNRSPTPAEISVSLPFIERHIALVKPKLIILCGAVPAQTLLGRTEGISRLRKASHTYTTRTGGLTDPIKDIPAIATYHPDYLLKTPLQKRAVWADILNAQAILQKAGQSG